MHNLVRYTKTQWRHFAPFAGFQIFENRQGHRPGAAPTRYVLLAGSSLEFATMIWDTRMNLGVTNGLERECIGQALAERGRQTGNQRCN